MKKSLLVEETFQYEVQFRSWTSKLDFVIMNPKYSKLKKEYEQLKKDFSNPEFVRDQNQLKESSKRFAELERMVKKMERLEILKRQIEGSQDLISSETDENLLSIAQQELVDYQEEKKQMEQELENEVSPKNPLDDKNVIMEIRAGTGGNESTLFVAELFRMYSRFAEEKKWGIQSVSSNRTGIGGFKEIIFKVTGKKAYSTLKYESGTHRVQRVPETEKSGRLHTSTVTVAVLPEAQEVDVKINPADLRIDVFRASGHGGQSVNTTDSAVRITHLPTDMVVTCQDERSQLQNKIKAMQILRSRLLASVEQKRRQEQSRVRKVQIGSGDRSEKIRTYNFPQDRVTDHRIKKSWHNIQSIVDGKIDQIIQELKKVDI